MILTGFVIGGYNIVGFLKEQSRVYRNSAEAYCSAAFVYGHIAFYRQKGALYLTLIAFGTPLGLNAVVFPAACGGDTSTGAIKWR